MSEPTKAEEFLQRLAVVLLRRLDGRIDLSSDEKAFLKDGGDSPSITITTPVIGKDNGRGYYEHEHTGEIVVHIVGEAEEPSDYRTEEPEVSVSRLIARARAEEPGEMTNEEFVRRVFRRHIGGTSGMGPTSD